MELPGYECLSLLGSGQYGDVFLVRRKSDQQLFAAKISNYGSAFGAMRLQQQQQERQEAELLKKLQHNNIIKCIETIERGEQLAIIMEYARGGDLAGYLEMCRERKEVLNEQEVMRIFIQIALALAYLHESHVLHRDLKPKNILLDAHGIIKVSDFGVSRVLQHTLDVAQTVIGTPYYMAPELMEDRPYDSKSDVWSLGCVLYELATFTPPFQGKALGAVVYQVLHTEPAPLSSRFSRPLQELARQMLMKEPQRRPGIKHILLSDIVQFHMRLLVSAAPFQQSFVSEKYGTPAITPQHLPMPVSVYPFNPSGPNEHNQVIAERMYPPPPVEKSDRPSVNDTARQLFFENQAAARRNRQKVEIERAAPPVFLDVPSPVQMHKPHHIEVAQPVQWMQNTPQAPNQLDYARQCYMENVRAAKLNRQRALEDVERAPSIPVISSDTRTLVSSVVVPPPAPSIVASKAKTGSSNYEELLEAERRRIRLETKALHERMRVYQTSEPHNDEMEAETESNKA